MKTKFKKIQSWHLNGFTLISKACKGFTLIEILIYMGLFSMFMVVLTNIFISSLDVKLGSEANSATLTDGRFILARLEHDVSAAQAISTPAALGEVGDSLTLTNLGDTLTYTLDGTDLILTDSTSSGKLNSSETKVTSLNFHKIGNADGGETVQINMTLESTTAQRGKTEIRDYQTTIGVR